jgi:cellulose synthase/poly-beta-1,6-N-acetylglucosamine synthase-like glycosyltransferase
MMWGVDIVIVLLCLPILAAAFYLFALAVLARRMAPAAPARGTPRFDIVVPSHNEELGIAQTVKSLLAIEYPRDRFRVLVIADNCTDTTADRAREAGATVLVRNDTSKRGKGYALAHAFEHVLAGDADAVVVVDADTSVSPNLLAAFASRLEQGAHAVQADYGVRNAKATWRTRLMTLALTLFHGVRSLARERMHLSAGLRGNGMCFSREALTRVPHDAFSIVEDLEYGLKLGQAGYRIYYASEAHVWGDMVGGERQSRSQRQRWEAGRKAIRRTLGPRMLKEGLVRRDAVLFDLAMDLLVPPLASIVVGAAVGTAASLLAVIVLHRGLFVAIPWLASSLMLVLYVLRGVALSGLGARGLLDLLWAPVYIVWKLVVAVRGSGAPAGQWVRTTRDGEIR